MLRMATPHHVYVNDSSAVCNDFYNNLIPFGSMDRNAFAPAAANAPNSNYSATSSPSYTGSVSGEEAMRPMSAASAVATCLAVGTVDSKLPKVLKHKRRYCKAPGCSRIVKSQGLCQRHGAKPKTCKVPGCHKQAQGNFDGMCKSHFKAHKRATTPLPPKPDMSVVPMVPPPPSGESVYDHVIPESLAWTQESGTVMPLIAHLKLGFDEIRPPAWHRNDERRARGLWPVHNPATQLEGWERELVWTEILVLTGNPQSSFRHLARGWGRDKGFHMVLAQFICERHGDVERKKRERNIANPVMAASLLAAANADAARLTEPSAAGVSHHSVGVSQSGECVGANVWDDACYGDAAYNEALAADLLNFGSSPDHHHAAQAHYQQASSLHAGYKRSQHEQQEQNVTYTQAGGDGKQCARQQERSQSRNQSRRILGADRYADAAAAATSSSVAAAAPADDDDAIEIESAEVGDDDLVASSSDTDEFYNSTSDDNHESYGFDDDEEL